MTRTSTPGRRAAPLPLDERRSAIVEAARPLLAEYGETVTTRQIAEAAGVAEGTIFRAFADKDELLCAVLDAALDQAPLERGLAAIDPEASFEERLVAATTIMQRRVADVWALVSNLGPRLRQRASGPVVESPALIAIVESGADRLRVEPRRAARMLRALTLSLTHPMLAGEPTPAADIVAVLLRGIEKPS